MAQVYVDPNKLRRFSKELAEFAGVVDDQMRGLKSHLGRLGETWRDQEFEAFVNQFSSVQQHLRKFTEETKRTAPLLERDAARIEDFFRDKPPV
jgi:uncharacterized protein YukE